MPIQVQEKESPPPLSAENYTFLERYIHDATGIALGEDKQYLLEARLMPVLRDERLGSLNELSGRLRQGAPEFLRRRIAESMTTHETTFFRDSAVFDMLRTELLPELAREHRSSRDLRIWSAAASSGQEAYSLAMLLLEAGYGDWKLDILGTDFSSRILAQAKAGRYLQLEVNRGLPAHLLVKYFQKAGLEWQIRDHVRRLVRFEVLDLRQPLSGFGPFDLVLCRNVLMYFELATRKRIIAELRRTLCPGGYLLLGASETTFNLDVNLGRRTLGNAVAYQKTASGATP